MADHSTSWGEDEPNHTDVDVNDPYYATFATADGFGGVQLSLDIPHHNHSSGHRRRTAASGAPGSALAHGDDDADVLSGDEATASGNVFATVAHEIIDSDIDSDCEQALAASAATNASSPAQTGGHIETATAPPGSIYTRHKRLAAAVTDSAQNAREQPVTTTAAQSFQSLQSQSNAHLSQRHLRTHSPHTGNQLLAAATAQSRAAQPLHSAPQQRGQTLQLSWEVSGNAAESLSSLLGPWARSLQHQLITQSARQQRSPQRVPHTGSNAAATLAAVTPAPVSQAQFLSQHSRAAPQLHMHTSPRLPDFFGTTPRVYCPVLPPLPTHELGGGLTSAASATCFRDHSKARRIDARTADRPATAAALLAPAGPSDHEQFSLPPADWLPLVTPNKNVTASGTFHLKPPHPLQWPFPPAVPRTSSSSSHQPAPSAVDTHRQRMLRAPSPLLQLPPPPWQRPRWRQSAAAPASVWGLLLAADPATVAALSGFLAAAAATAAHSNS